MGANNDHNMSRIKSITLDLIAWNRMALTESAEALASYEFGQFVLKHTDKALWLIEKTSQWSLPPPANGKDDKTLVTSELTRPLPWVFFLPTLLIIRLFREIISTATYLVGRGPIKPIDMVRYIQNWRRSLRAIKYHGIRNIRVKNQNKVARCEEAQGGFSAWMEWFYEKIKGLLCYKVVRYSNGKQPKLLRENSGEPLLVVKKAPSHKKRALSPDDSDDERFDADSALKELASKIDLLPDTDSDDTEYSFKNDSNNLDTSYTSTDDDDEEEKNIVEPEDKQDGQKGAGTSQKAPESSQKTSESLKKSTETSPKKTEAPQKLTETSPKASENSHKAPEASKKSPEASQKSPEASHRPPEASQKTSEASHKPPEASQKSPEASQKTPEAFHKPLEASQKSPETSHKSPEASRKPPETSQKIPEAKQKSPETSQKKPETPETSPKDSQKSTEKNQDKREVQTVGAKTQNEELLFNGEMQMTPSKDENVNKAFIEGEKKSVGSNIPSNLPGPTSPDHHPTESVKKDSPNQPTKGGKNSKTGSPQKANIENLQPTQSPKSAADETTNRSAEKSPK